MDFAGNALAPNVLLIKKHLVDLSAEWLLAGRPKLDYSFPRRENKKDKATRIVKFDSTIGLQAGFGFAPFFDNDCRTEIFTDSTSLVSVYPNDTSTSFIDAGLIGASPLTIYSISPFVMMVDEEALSPAPIPSRWEDLLDSRFENKIIITSEAAESNVAVLSFYALFGPDGARAFLNNISQTASASVMPSLTQKGANRASVYIIPWFFARCSAAKKHVVTIWPEEGALSFPLWLAMRGDASEGSRFISSFFTGESFARESAQACLPAINAASDRELSADCRKFHWVGWEYLRSLDIKAYLAFIDSLVSVSKIRDKQ